MYNNSLLSDFENYQLVRTPEELKDLFQKFQNNYIYVSRMNNKVGINIHKSIEETSIILKQCIVDFAAVKRENFIECIKISKIFDLYLNKTWLNDKSFVNELVEYLPDQIFFAPKEISSDKNIRRKALKNNIQLLFFMNKKDLDKETLLFLKSEISEEVKINNSPILMNAYNQIKAYEREDDLNNILSNTVSNSSSKIKRKV